MKQSKSRKVSGLNALGSLGYIACLLQWLWMLLILLPAIVGSSFFRFLTKSDTVKQLPVTESTGSVSAGGVPIIVTVVALLLAGLIVIWAVYVLIVKLPKSVAKTGEKVTHTVAEVISPVVIQHTHLPERKQRQIPELVIVIMKFMLVFVPLYLLLFAQGMELAMSFELILATGFVLFSWAFLLFALQYMVSKLLKVHYKDLR